MDGKVIVNRRAEKGDNTVDTHGLSKGIYLLSVRTPNQTFHKLIRKY